jgi:sec-independent protein translocase protein TatA
MIANIFGPDLGIIVLVILVVLVGGSQLPKIARNVGIAGKEFRKAQQEAEEDAERDRQTKAANEARPAMAIPPAAPQPPERALQATPPTVPQGEQQATPPAGEGNISLTPAELEALLKAREQQVRSEGPNN